MTVSDRSKVTYDTVKWDFIAEPRCTVIHVGSGLDFWQLTTIHCFCEFEKLRCSSVTERDEVGSGASCLRCGLEINLPASR